MPKLAAILLIAITFNSSSAIAQKDSINFTRITSKDGLSSNIVRAILKDHYGWMWFATEDGLNRFDGNHFTVYRHQEKEHNSLPASDITALFEDSAGNLWVGTNGGGLCLYDRNNDTFINMERFEGGASLSSSTIRTICNDSSGNVWTASYTGIFRIDPIRRKITLLPFSPRPLINCLFEDSRHTIWIGTSNGLYNEKNGRFNPVATEGNNIKAVAEDPKGNIWIGTSTGLSRRSPDGHSTRNFPYPVFTLAPDPVSGKIWIGMEDGLNILDPATDEVLTITPDKRRSYGLSRKSVRALYIDPHGIYWVGTFQGGINKFDKNLSLFQLRQSNPFDEHGLSNSVVTSFAEGKDSTVYIGTDGGGLNVFHRRTGLFSHPQLSPSLAILAMEKDHSDKLWIGTYGKGVFLMDPSGSCRQFTKGTGPDSIDNNDIFCIKEDKEGRIWLGTNGSGVNIYDPVTRRFHNPGLAINKYIRAIEEDTDGNIWIASHGGGIVRLNPATSAIKVFTKANSSLPGNTVFTVLRDSRGRLWMGTAGGGLSLYDPQTGDFTTWSEKDGLSNTVVYKIMEDNSGLLWVSTNAGISSFDPTTRHFTNYNWYNGVQRSNFVLGSGLRLRDGELYFGGLDGFNFFDPRLLRHNNNSPAVVLTELRVANQAVAPSAGGPIREQISIAEKINLDYRQSFSISYAALDYTSAQQNNYAYKLDGFDRDYNFVGPSKTASYTNLDPGDYTFRVRVRNSDGVWNSTGAAISIHIRPPWWRTIYAYIFYAAFAICVFLFYRHKTVQKIQRRFMAEEEKRRVRQLIEQQRNEARVARELDQMKIRFLTNLSHEFRTPISLIMGPVDNLLSRPHAESESGQLRMIRRNGRRLLNLVNQLLDFRKMEENELSLHPADGEAISFIKEAFDSFKDLSEKKQIDYTFHSNQRLLPASFDHDKLERILFNLLSNAFKFTPAGGRIRVDVQKLPSREPIPPSSDPLSYINGHFQPPGNTTWLRITISDTGIGIPEDKKQNIFDRFFQINSPDLLNQGSGIGLSIASEFVKMQGGTIEVESRPGAGTIFSVQLPFHLTTAPANPKPQPIPPTEPAKPTTSPSSDDKIKPLILLVEDDDDFRFYLKDNLRHYYKVIEATNGKEGWQKTLSHHPLLVVSDISMPVMDGIQLSNKIKSDKRTLHTPVILLTALTGEEQQLKGLATGANDYVTKPFNFEILNSKIKNLLRLNHSLKTTYSRQIQVKVPEQPIESSDATLIKDIRLYIEDHLMDPQLSVDHLSRHVGMSRSSLYSKMLDLTGQTPIEYIRAVKLDKAAILLEKSTLNMAQVAYETGFATPNYFAKSFKTRFNMLPSEYASLKRKKPSDN